MTPIRTNICCDKYTAGKINEIVMQSSKTLASQGIIDPSLGATALEYQMVKLVLQYAINLQWSKTVDWMLKPIPFVNL